MNQETKMHEEVQAQEKKILDSGNRRQFSSGAVRDISDDKGDTSLLPFHTISEFAAYCENKEECQYTFSLASMFGYVHNYQTTHDVKFIYELLRSFINKYFDGSLESAIIGYSKQLQGGAIKYLRLNWMLGLNTHCFLDSGLRHGLKVLRGDQDEPHDRAFIWNFMGLLWTLRHHPELDDIFYGDKFDSETIGTYHKGWSDKK